MRLRKWLTLSLTSGLLPVAALAGAPAEPVKAPPGTPVTIIVKPAEPTAPTVSITQGLRHGHVVPVRSGFTHTGGGNTDVAQPSVDTLVLTQSGIVVAGGHPCKCSVASMDFELDECFEIVFEKPEVKAAKLTLEGRVIGLLRSESSGSAEEGGAVTVAPQAGGPAVSLALPSHAVAGGESLSINDHDGPVSLAIPAAGKYSIHQSFHISASHPKSVLPCKAASAEFAPDPALDPLWISYWEPFHGAVKKDFGFQITLKVADDTPTEPEKKEEKPPEKEKLPLPPGPAAAPPVPVPAPARAPGISTMPVVIPGSSAAPIR